MKGMGPDGRWLEGVEYYLSCFQTGVNIERGEYPMRPELGSTLHRQIGQPMGPPLQGAVVVAFSEIVRQVGRDLVLASASVTEQGRGLVAEAHLKQTLDGQPIRLEGVRIG